MSIEAGLLPPLFIYLLFAPAAVIMWQALRNINYAALKQLPTLQHVFYMAILVMCILWSIRAGLSSGLGIHFLGLTATTLLMGWALAIIAGAFVCLAMSILGLESYASFAVNFMVCVALPVFSSYLVLKLVQRNLPANPFVYIFLCGFFNGALAILCVNISTSLILGLLNVYEWETVYESYFMYVPLMLFPEAFVNGMIVAGVIGTKPELLSSFNVDEYFKD